VRRETPRLSRRHQALLYGVFGLLFLSGALWLLLHHYLRVEGEFGPEPHVLEPLSLKLHGALAMAFLVVLGTLVRGHVQAGWRAHRNRVSGSGLLAANAVLVVTGWALYYLSGETLRALCSTIHWGLGLLLPGAILWHARQGVRSRLKEAVRRRAGEKAATSSRLEAPGLAARASTSGR